MSEIGDEFKVVIVKAIKVLCLKYPSKHRSMLAFLHNALREEGGFQFKKAIVDAILDLLNQVPEMKIEGLNALNWEMSIDRNTPQQLNTVDCGIFMLIKIRLKKIFNMSICHTIIRY